MEVSYKCECGHSFKLKTDTKPQFNAKCEKCGKLAKRNFGKISLDKEPDNVSGAIQMMLHAPSNKNVI